MKKLKRIVFALGASIMCTACAGVNAATYTKGTPVKVGLICLHNEKSTYDKNFIDAMKEAANDLGSRIAGEPIIKTDVAESIDSYNAAKDLVKQGCNVIIADSFGHEPFMLRAAKEWPSVTFCHATGTQAKVAGVSNYHNAFASIYEGRYLAGYAAGLKLADMIEDGKLTDANYDGDKIKLGYVGAYPYAEVVSGYTSWFLGVKAVVPNVKMQVTFTNSWYDFDAEKAGARTLKNNGAAIISQHADSMGAPGECEEMGVPNVTYNIPLDVECPNTYLAYSKIDWAPYYKAVVNGLYDGTGIVGEVNNNFTGTIADGSVKYACADEGYADILKDVEAELKAKTRRVFDCSTFTVKGEHLTVDSDYLADVDDMHDYVSETKVIKEEGGITFYDESAFRSAPYFDINIDDIEKLN
ncbi:MAG: BMP family ABC transporter substrate-binding protein [Bacilli bacterium]|nr:BMP family ABC transporter substrate-binding protein [Bacilli bacterium]